MSSFTSALISTTNLGTWDYYIFSDNVGIWRAMNGLASWFNASGGMIQGAAWLGALLILTMTLFSIATHKPGVGAPTIGVWFFFMTMMGTTGQANVYNIYTGQITVIQNVPALALIPASVFSKAAYNVFISMDTAFQSVNGSYMSVSQNGFVGPLEILLALRSPSSVNAMPSLNQTLTQVVHDCAVDRNITAPTPVSLNDSLDMLDWLTKYGRQNGLTTITTEFSFEPQIVGCGSALTYLNDQYSILAGGSAPLLKLINSSTKAKNPQDPKGLWNASNLSGSYEMIMSQAGGVQQSATQFTKNALVASTITYTIDCLNQSGTITSPEGCAQASFLNADTMSRWQTEAAMNGSGFLKTMFTSMALLQALFFALFPIIALYGLIVVQNTAKVFGGYIFFGVWCQSWLMFVVPIQSYIQTSIVDEMTKITAGSSGMTLANSMQLYTTLATKLAVAGDIMASTQMISLAVLSGSMIALSSLAGKWSGEKHVDTSKVQLDPVKTAPMQMNAPSRTQQGIMDANGKMVGITQDAGAVDYKLSSLTSAGRSETTGHSRSQENSATRSTESALSVIRESGLSFTKGAAEKLSQNLAATSSWQGAVQGSTGAAMEAARAIMSHRNGGAPLSAKQEKALSGSNASKLMEAAIASETKKNPGFIGDITGQNGGDKMAEALGTSIDIATGLIVAGSAATGVGVAALPAELALGQAAKLGVKAAAKKWASSGKGQAILGAAADVAKGVAGDAGVMYQAKVEEALRSENSDSGDKKVTDSIKTTASKAAKQAQSFKESETSSVALSTAKSQSDTLTAGYGRAQIIATARRGNGDLTGKQLISNAAMTRIALLSKFSDDPAAIEAAYSQISRLQAGASVDDYGTGQMASDYRQYESDVLLEKILTGSTASTLGGVKLHPLAPSVAKNMNPNAAPGAAAANAEVGKRSADYHAEYVKAATPKPSEKAQARHDEGVQSVNNQLAGVAAAHLGGQVVSNVLNHVTAPGSSPVASAPNKKK